MMSALAFTIACLNAARLSPQVWFYGGDMDDRRGPVSCERNTRVADARVYDDFDLLQPATEIDGLWGNFLIEDGFVPKQAYFEIRKGISPGDGGALLASGDIYVVVFRTGRELDGYTEYHVRGHIPRIALGAGRYFLTLAPIGYGYGRSYIVIALPVDQGPSGDPNPLPTGSPLGNGNAFFDGPKFGFHWSRAEDVTGDPPPDFSCGVGVLDTVAPAMLLPDSFTATRGVLQSGTPHDLWGTDDQRVIVQERPPGQYLGAECTASSRGCGATKPLQRIRQQGGLDYGIPMHGHSRRQRHRKDRVIRLRGSKMANISQRASSGADHQTKVTVTGHYVQPNTNRLRARIGWFSQGVVNLNWSGQVDWILWDVAP